jgi:demethylmenaquinone methyltransferase/2-methoxy-6-polyprenyl-1,4-benzoquinol methylase
MARNFLFDWVAPFYDMVIRSPGAERLEHLLDLPVEGWMLDAGGGTGRVSAHFRPLVGQLVVSDLSHAMLRQAYEKCTRCPTRAHVERLPFADGSFERLLVVDALHHFENQQVAVGELLRVLQPGGRLVIEEPDVRRFAVKLVALGERLALMQSHFLPPDRILELVNAYSVDAYIEQEGHIAWIIVDKPLPPIDRP